MPTPSTPACDSFVEDVAQLRRRIDRRLAELLPGAQAEGDQLGLAMRSAVLSPGKRIRPLMLVLAARELGARESAVLDLGCALELVHAASLVLDDMPCMDDAALRRGEPTVHRRFGEDVAVLTSVALLSLAYRIIASAAELPPVLRGELVAVLADAVGADGLVRGQYEDLRQGNQPREAHEVAGTNQRKTGVLFAAALEMAARAAAATEAERQALRELAGELGQAFQLYDDLCDSDPATAPLKDTGKDAGKSTLVALLGPEAARWRLRQHVQRVEARAQAVFGADSGLSQLVQQLFTRL